MKRRILFLFLISLLSISLMTGCFNTAKDHGAYEPPSDPENDLVGVDYQQNNRQVNFSDFLVQIGDKLYMIVPGYEMKNLCEISDDKIRVVYTESNDLDEAEMSYGDNLYVLNDQLCIPHIGFDDSKYTDRHFDFDTGEITGGSEVYFESSGLWYPRNCGGRLYVCDDSTILRCDGNGKTTVLATANDLEAVQINELYLTEKKLGDYYISEPYIYYETQTKNASYLCRYDCQSREIVNKVKVAECEPMQYPNIANLIADGDDVYCLERDAIYHIDLRDDTCEKLYTIGDEISLLFNYSGGKLYIAPNADRRYGIYELDPQHPDELRAVVEDPDLEILSLYIFDDTYIYYDCDIDGKLSRVRISDGKTEEVLDYQKYSDTDAQPEPTTSKESSGQLAG